MLKEQEKMDLIFHILHSCLVALLEKTHQLEGKTQSNII